jgi:phosphoribosyl-ATP pyrophosphohydrolase
MSKTTFTELKKEAVKNLEEKSDLYYDVLVDMSSGPVKEAEVLREIIKRLINTEEKYRHLAKT